MLQGWQRIEPLPLSGSERRLFRLRKRKSASSKSAILVDARDDDADDDASVLAPYLQRLQTLTDFLTRAGLRVPRIEAIDCKHDVAVIEDLGENSYARCLMLRGVEACAPLFQHALDDLIRLSLVKRGDTPAILPAFDEERFVGQTMPFADAFLDTQQRLVWQELWSEIYHEAAFDLSEIAPVLGDVHVENMFVLAERDPQDDARERCAFIDFQDAHMAPRCYDVVSLLEDGLWEMPSTLRDSLWGCYKRAHAERGMETEISSAARHYEVCALHRDMMMAGILQRLWRVRGEERYGIWLRTTVRRCRKRLAEEARFAKIKKFVEPILTNK